MGFFRFSTEDAARRWKMTLIKNGIAANVKPRKWYAIWGGNPGNRSGTDYLVTIPHQDFKRACILRKKLSTFGEVR